MSSMIGCRESDAGHYKEICEKRLHSNYVCCEDGISQPIKCRIFSIHPIAFPLLMWHFQVTRHIFPHGKQKSPRQQALHLTCWVLCIDRTMHRNVSVDIFFLESLVCNFLMRFITWELTFSFHFSMAIWNDWKGKLSCQEVTHESGNWTKCYDWSAGLKRKCQLAVAQTTTPRQKCTRTASHWRIWYPHACTRSKIINFVFRGKSIVIWSWA